MMNLLRLGTARRMGHLLAAAAVAAVLVATMALALASQASAAWPIIFEEQYGPCGSCASVNGSEYFPAIDLNYAFNRSGLGVCSTIWWRFPNGYWEPFTSCTSNASEAVVELVADNEGHGEASRYYQRYYYNLEGFEYFEV